MQRACLRSALIPALNASWLSFSTSHVQLIAQNHTRGNAYMAFRRRWQIGARNSLLNARIHHATASLVRLNEGHNGSIRDWISGAVMDWVSLHGDFIFVATDNAHS